MKQTALDFMREVLVQGRNNYKRAQKKPSVTEGELESLKRKTGYYEEAVDALEKYGSHIHHYVLINEWALNGNYGRDIVGIAHTKEELREIFKSAEAKEREIARENKWEIFNDTKDEFRFEAAETDYYPEAHTVLTVVEFINSPE
jgi:hypothetical protein